MTIRRRPPHGVEAQNCGPVDFKVPLGGATREERLYGTRHVGSVLVQVLLDASFGKQGKEIAIH